MSNDVSHMLRALPRRRFDAAKPLVDREAGIASWKYLIMFGSLGCTAVLLLGSVITLAVLEQGPVLIGIAIFVSLIPFVAGIAGMAPKTTAKKVLDAMTCPQCAGASSCAADDPSNTYVLVCEQCQVVWETAVSLPGTGGYDDPGHHHHHHHHHF